MDPLCELEERQGVDLGRGYKNDQACTTFVEYIVKDQHEILAYTMTSAKFISLQTDGSMDAGDRENELFLALYFHFICQGWQGALFLTNFMCPGMTGTWQIKLNIVLTLRQSNFEMLLEHTVEDCSA